jgi:membrane fusion protein, copper/silver efflux system
MVKTINGIFTNTINLKNKNMKRLFSNKYFRYGLFALAGLFVGWLFFHSPHKTEEKQSGMDQISNATIWTCAMHPQIRMEQPGKCPICGMDLIPLAETSTSSIDPGAIHLTKEAAQLANVLTSIVTKQKPIKEVRLYGKVKADERLLQSQVAHVPGRIERLYINFTGESVKKGQILAQIYSPELITAQQELLETVKTKQLQPELYEASKEKLRQWKLTDNQIITIEESGSVQNTVEVVSNTNGIVTAKRVNTGDYVSQGTVLFEIADLSQVWVLFDAYESDLQFLSKGEKISFTLQALPGNKYSGNIVFIDPVIDPVTRVAKVRIEISNQSGKLKPEMSAIGIVSSTLIEYSDNLVIPKSAVLWTGKRSIVYVKQPGTIEPVFKMREIGLGPMLGESYVVTDGLSEGEEIVTSGTFSVDAAAQLEGKLSMMNPQGGKTSSMPGMIMPGDNKTDNAALTTSSVADAKNAVSVKNIVTTYLQIKNALTDDNTIDAATAGNALEAAFKNFDKTTLTEVQKKTFEDVENDAREHAEHIGKSGGNIAHQREHFEILSNDIYDLIKTFGGGQVLYKDFDSMYNNGKGAFWISETKEIKNPYMGKAMLTSGSIKEEINSHE